MLTPAAILVSIIILLTKSSSFRLVEAIHCRCMRAFKVKVQDVSSFKDMQIKQA